MLIGKRIVETRANVRMSASELSIKSGVGASHISEIENGKKRNVTVITATKIAEALGVSLDYLTGISDNNNYDDELKQAMIAKIKSHDYSKETVGDLAEIIKILSK